MFHRLLTSLGFVALLALPVFAADGVKLTEQADKVRVEINGELFTEYCFKGTPTFTSIRCSAPVARR